LGKTKLDRSQVPRLSLWVLSAPLDSCAAISDALLEFGLSGQWLAQPAADYCYQLRVHSRLQSPEIPLLTSTLARFRAPFELETLERMPERYLFHPGLGIHRQQLNQAGEVLIREDAIASAIAASQGNSKEIERRLRQLSGTTWLDLLEPYRNHEGLRVLPKAV
jgi:hypothetical protein